MKKCFICNKNIIDKKHPDKIYCSVKCRSKARQNRIKTKCLNCGKEIFTKKSQTKRGRGKYCSYHCKGWKGGFSKKQNGYILIYKPQHPKNKNGYVLYHRFIMEQKLKRFLKSSELVHHIDENIFNNHITNLMLCKNIAEHRYMHRKSLK